MSADEFADLIRRAQGREEAAFDTIVDRYSARLYGYLYRLTGSRIEAEDLLQEVFIRVVRMIGRYEHDTRFDAWLFRIATNLVRDRVRRVRRAPATTGQEPDGDWGDAPAPSDTTDPSRRMELAEAKDQLQKALEQLSPAEREVIMLRHFSELSFKEIAETMGTPLGTALARAHRGLRRLREIMSDPADAPDADNGLAWNGADPSPAT